MSEARRLRIGEVAQFRMPAKYVVERQYQCQRCLISFSAWSKPRYCISCGKSWNGKLISRSSSTRK